MKTIEVTETEYDYLQKIRVVLAKDQRVELVPNIGKGTVKVLSVKREEVKAK